MLAEGTAWVFREQILIREGKAWQSVKPDPVTQSRGLGMAATAEDGRMQFHWFPVKMM